MSNLIDVGTSKLGYRRIGAGPDVVLIHGWPLHGETWRNIAPHLAERFTCHILDLPGTGRSEWSDRTPMTLHAHGRAVSRAIETLGLTRVGLVAHDSGGVVARLVAGDLGERCFGLVFGDSEIANYRPPLLLLLVAMCKMPGGAWLLPRAMRLRLVRESILGFGGCFSDLRFLDGEFGRLFVEPLLRDPRVMAGQAGLARQFDWGVLDRLPATHARITAPVQMMWGVDDPWFPLSRARAMLSDFRGGARMRELPGKLFTHEEHPQQWAAHARTFLEEAHASTDRVRAVA